MGPERELKRFLRLRKKETDRQTDRHSHIQTQTEKQTYREIAGSRLQREIEAVLSAIYIHGKRDGDRQTETDRERDRD